MWSAKRRRTAFTITIPKNDAFELTTKDPVKEKIMVERQVQPVSQTAQGIAPAWVTMVATNTEPVVGAGIPQTVGRAPLASDPASPAPFAPSLVASTAVASGIPPSAATRAVNAATSTSSVRPTPLSVKPDTNGQMTKWTEKILIITVSIAGSLLIAFVVIMLYRRKTGKKPIALFQRKDAAPQPPTKPYHRTELGEPWNSSHTLGYPSLRDKPAWEMNSSVGSLLYKPTAVFNRPETAASSRPSLLGLPQQPSRSPFPPPNRLPSPTPLADRNVQYVDPRQSRLQFTMPTQLPRRASVASTTLPIDGPRKDTESQKRRSSVSSIAPLERMQLKTSQPPRHQPTSTDWNAPKIPVESSRFSVATSVSDAPRHRTVESWVGLQAGRFNEFQIQQHLERDVEHKMNSAHASGTSTPNGPPNTLRDPAAIAAWKRLNDATSDIYYMPHPGTQVPLPAGGRIPSEILDSKIGPRGFEVDI